MHMGVALRQELDPADRADIIGLLHRIDQLVAVEAPRALNRVGDDVDVVVGGIAAIGGSLPNFFTNASTNGSVLGVTATPGPETP